MKDFPLVAVGQTTQQLEHEDLSKRNENDEDQT